MRHIRELLAIANIRLICTSNGKRVKKRDDVTVTLKRSGKRESESVRLFGGHGRTGKTIHSAAFKHVRPYGAIRSIGVVLLTAVMLLLSAATAEKTGNNTEVQLNSNAVSTRDNGQVHLNITELRMQ